ncbi:hypothetical protein JK363_16250 [Streptomyces sp. 205]|uniref:DUF3558 domain-containing protein n=2 Tax=Streptomyces coffeae TaxID=621382 RepID=A0ABS1NDP0_9ACTN|nr:hypothetical protein [Streptomyces coffeae]
MPAMPMAGYGQLGAPTGIPPVMPPNGSGGGPAGAKVWLWGLGGALVASAVWAGALLATGGFGGDDEPKADLAGYTYTDDLCDPTDTKTFEDEGYKADGEDSRSSSNPAHSSSQDPALDSMDCNITFKPDGASSGDYSELRFYTSALLHKKTDPQPEFEANYRAYEDRKSSSYGYDVKAVGGLGDEAYVVTQTNESSSSSGTYVILGIRDGWMTYQSTWSEYVSSSSDAKGKTNDEAIDLLKKSAKATLQKMKG